MGKELIERLRSEHRLDIWNYDSLLDAADEIERLQTGDEVAMNLIAALQHESYERKERIAALEREIERLQTERVILNACSNTAAVLEMHSRIATLEAENERLKRTEAHITGLHVTTLADWQKLKAENEALKKDAARATSSIPETSPPIQQGECQSPGKTARSAK